MRNVTLNWLVLLVAVAGAACIEGSSLEPSTLAPPRGVDAAVRVAVPPPPRGGQGAASDFRRPIFAETAPPPITGGTLLASRDGARLVATDPARDEVWVVALPGGSVLAHHALEAGAEPGRVAEGVHGEFHVALRAAGDVVSLSRDGAVVDRRYACSAPRGLVVEGAALHVACAEGLLVSFAAAGGPAQRIVELEPDLRDVVVDEATGNLAVSLFRRAEVLFLDRHGVVVARRSPPRHEGPRGDVFGPNVAWRMRAAPGAGVLVLHQRSVLTPLALDGPAGDAGYGSGECSVGVVQAVLSHVSRDGDRPAAPTILGVSVAVDFDVQDDRVLVVAPGVLHTPRPGVVLRTMHQGRYLRLSEAVAPGGPGACVSGPSLPLGDYEAQLTSVTALPTGEWMLQGREPAIVVRDGELVTTFPTRSIADDGHAFFHQRPGVAIACASCHPEGGEDGHTWRFEGVGARRTQTLRGPLLASAPFHWGGDVPSFAALAHATIERRMGGPELDGVFVDGIARFVEAVPHLPRAVVEDPEAAARGAALFASTETGCTDCHRGERLSDDRTVDVGTGGAFQVPGLRGLRYRAPYLHDGRAETLHDALFAAGAGHHGDTAQLSPAQREDLVAFLESL